MDVRIHPNADREFFKFDHKIREKFLAIFKYIREGERLPGKRYIYMPGTKGLYEARVKTASGIYRGLCGKVKGELIIVVFFHKKSGKTPRRFVELAQNRLKHYR